MRIVGWLLLLLLANAVIICSLVGIRVDVVADAIYKKTLNNRVWDYLLSKLNANQGFIIYKKTRLKM